MNIRFLAFLLVAFLVLGHAEQEVFNFSPKKLGVLEKPKILMKPEPKVVFEDLPVPTAPLEQQTTVESEEILGAAETGSKQGAPSPTEVPIPKPVILDDVIAGRPISAYDQKKKKAVTFKEVVDEFADSFKSALESDDPSDLFEKFMFFSSAPCLNDFFSTTRYFNNFHVSPAGISEDDMKFSLKIHGELTTPFAGILKDELQFSAVGFDTLKIMMIC